MAAEPKPLTRPIWAETGDKPAPADPKKSLGWVTEIPPYEWFNWVLNNLATFAAHVNESGIPEWDELTSYDIDALVKGSDGSIYQSLSNSNINNNPPFNPSDWKLAFVSAVSYISTSSHPEFKADDLPIIKLIIDSSFGPYTIKGAVYTHTQLTSVYNDILNELVSILES